MPDFKSILADLESRSIRRYAPGEFTDHARDFSSNDYLGLANDRALREKFLNNYTWENGFSTSASRLLAGRQSPFTSVESLLKRLYGRPALIFNSGYHANTGAISALGKLPSTLIVADRLVHASIIDGIVLSRTKFIRFRHNDVANLRDILNGNASGYRNILVVTESVFSMDGDIAPLSEIVALKKDFPNMMLYVDEAHAFGVFGEKGLGILEREGLIHATDFIAGTLGKAAASTGAFVIASPEAREFLYNSARSLIFSTALPPVNMEWTHFILSRLAEMSTRREHLFGISRILRSAIEEITGEENPSSSQIIPLMIRDSARAVEISNRLEHLGFRALPVRKPTVPEGTERIRFSLGANHTEENVRQLISAIRKAL